MGPFCRLALIRQLSLFEMMTNPKLLKAFVYLALISRIHNEDKDSHLGSNFGKDKFRLLCFLSEKV